MPVTESEICDATWRDVTWRDVMQPRPIPLMKSLPGAGIDFRNHEQKRIIGLKLSRERARVSRQEPRAVVCEPIKHAVHDARRARSIVGPEAHAAQAALVGGMGPILPSKTRQQSQ